MSPNDCRKFTELIGPVEHLQANSIIQLRVCITTIQRLYAILRGEPDLDPLEEEQSLFETDADREPPKEVEYNPL